MAGHMNVHLPYFLLWLCKYVWYGSGKIAFLMHAVTCHLLMSFFVRVYDVDRSCRGFQACIESVEDRVQQGRSALHASSH